MLNTGIKPKTLANKVSLEFGLKTTGKGELTQSGDRISINAQKVFDERINNKPQSSKLTSGLDINA